MTLFGLVLILIAAMVCKYVNVISGKTPDHPQQAAKIALEEFLQKR